jgi:hypothetical protein
VVSSRKWSHKLPASTKCRQLGAVKDKVVINKSLAMSIPIHWKISELTSQENITYGNTLDHLRTLPGRANVTNIGLRGSHISMQDTWNFSSTPASKLSNIVLCNRPPLHPWPSGFSIHQHGVSIFAYGTLLGAGAAGATGPRNFELESAKVYSLYPCRWRLAAFRTVLQALSVIAQQHGVPVAAMATRYVLDLPAVAAVIVLREGKLWQCWIPKRVPLKNLDRSCYRILFVHML